MKAIKKGFTGIINRIKERPFLAALIGLSVVIIVVIVVIWSLSLPKKYSYLPDRDYILADTQEEAPKTLQELLYSNNPSIDSFLKYPSIAKELLSVKELTDIVDSRYALNSLRILENQLADRLDSSKAEVEIFDLGSYSSNNGVEKLSFDFRDRDFLQTEKLSEGHLIFIQEETLVALQEVVNLLLSSKEEEELAPIPSSINMKGVWQESGQVMLHMTPSGGWIPDEGYNLYREIDGKRELIEEGFASPTKGLGGQIEIEGWVIDDKEEYEKNKESNLIQELYRQAQLTESKLSVMGLEDENAFRNLVYLAGSLDEKPKIGGSKDFDMMREMNITIPANMNQKMPDSDVFFANPIYMMNQNNNSDLMTNALDLKIKQKFGLKPTNPNLGLAALEGQKAYDLAYEVYSARQQLITLGFVNDEFAEEAGFLRYDDLAGIEMKDNSQIAYFVETSDGHIMGRLFLENGKATELTKPENFKGYGLDGNVPLRWDEATSSDELNILIGYLIERRISGEKKFEQINIEPVTIAHILDETDHYFESPVFYADEVENGKTVEYRVRSLDVFGRMSEYSDVIKFKVEKVKPPNSPNIVEPTLSYAKKSKDYSAAQEAKRPLAILQSAEANKNKTGIILPIFTDSYETVRFTIYRAVQEGANQYGDPEVLADIEYRKPTKIDNIELIPSTTDIKEKKGKVTVAGKSVTSSKKVNKAKQITLKTEVSDFPDLIYFDPDVKAGHTYKYWVAAWDSWNNESPWSQSVTVAYPSNKLPTHPGNLDIKMLGSELIDFSSLPPGLNEDTLVTFKRQEKESDMPVREYADNVNLEIMKNASSDRSWVGQFVQNETFPEVIFNEYDNIPEDKYIHMLIGVRGEDILADGSVYLKWPAYSGDGLDGYMVYMPLFETKSLEEMQKMSREELMAMGQWQLINENPITQNQILVSGLEGKEGEVKVFLVCMKPDSFKTHSGKFDFSKFRPDFFKVTLLGQAGPDFMPFKDNPEGGFVDIKWQAPDDPQVAYYKVYRCEISKEEYLDDNFDTDSLDWILVGDRVKREHYTDPVEQSFARYYYYKITSVSAWGLESNIGSVQAFRVPSTKPPQTPNLLLPLSRKDGVAVNFAPVNHCDWYEIFRTAIPRPSQDDLTDQIFFESDFLKIIFDSPFYRDNFITGILSDVIDISLWSKGGIMPWGMAKDGGIVASNLAYLPQDDLKASLMNLSNLPPKDTPIMAFKQFKTVNRLSPSQLAQGFSNLGNIKGLSAYQNVFSKYGPLALADYGDLSKSMLGLIKWEKIGSVPASEQEVDPSGLLKPLSFIDETAEYGTIYLYTVQAWNDDNLGSLRSEPVEGSPRRNGPFDPITGLVGERHDIYPKLAWDLPKMKNLTEGQCKEDTVGYIVYRSDSENGNYYQASPLLFDREWIDKEGDMFANNWYKVKVLDTGGYLSDFSAPVLVKAPYSSNLTTVIPDDVEGERPPTLSFDSDSYTVVEGNSLDIAYNLTGTDPITVTVTVRDNNYNTISGFTVNTVSKTIKVPNKLQPATYTIIVNATNSRGQDSKTISLLVTSKPLEIIKPSLGIGATSFTLVEGNSLDIPYTLAGTDPIAVSVRALNSAGKQVGGFTIDSANKKIKVSNSLAVGSYNVSISASNSGGDDTKSFTLLVEEREVIALPPSLTLQGNSFTINEGSDFETSYRVTGSMPIIVSLEARTATGSPVSGFTIDQQRNIIKAPKNLALGAYTVSVKAKNTAGEVTKSFNLAVVPKEVTVTPPDLTLEGSSFTVISGNPFQMSYDLTGTEPIEVTLEAKDADGRILEGFFVNTVAKTIYCGVDMPEGTFRVTVTARNSAGRSDKSFTITFEPAQAETSPYLLPRDDNYNIEIVKLLRPSTVQFEASGTQPISWSLVAVSRLQPVPSQISINNNGLLTVGETIPLGNYKFKIRVTNYLGTDEKEVNLSVTGKMTPFAGGMVYSPIVSYANIPVEDIYESDQLRCLNFFLSDVKLKRPSGTIGVLLGYSGTAKLNLSGVLIPVNIVGAWIDTSGSHRMINGTVYIEKSFEAKDLNLTIVSLDISPNENKAEISGYMVNKDPSKNVLGDRYAISFSYAELRPSTIIIRRGVPKIRYNEFTIKNTDELWIHLNRDPDLDDDLFSLVGSTVDMKFHLETLDNESLQFETFSLSFDHNRKMNADLNIKKEASLRLIVPGGSALRVSEARLFLHKGIGQSVSYLHGKLVLPFERPDLGKGEEVIASYAGSHQDVNEMDALANLDDGSKIDGNSQLVDAMQNGLIKFGERVQQNGLLVAPSDFALQDLCSSVEIRVDEWTGKGFTMDSAIMTPVSIAERSLDIETQRSQGIIVKPTAVTVDLDRDSAAKKVSTNKNEKIMTPKETEEPFWVGLIMHGGSLSLPGDFVQKKGGGTIDFNLSMGEMIYDLNGFNYQTYLYSTKGVPAEFASALGGFPNVWIYDCLLDLYANRVNLEINAEVAIDLFRGNRVDAKLYTNKEDNADGKAGEFLCSLAPTKIKNAIVEGVDLEIDGGWFRPEGMYVNGSITLNIDEIKSGEEKMSFTDFIVPADISRSGHMSQEKRQYTAVTLDSPAPINFKGFTMEIRAFDLAFKPHSSGSFINGIMSFKLHGATLLAENIPLASDTNDSIMLTYSPADPRLKVLYEESESVLDANFDGCVDVSGVLVPKLEKGGFVEFDTSNLDLSFLDQLDNLPVNAYTRFGFDLVRQRCYFAVGMTPLNGKPINFGSGDIKGFTGITVYNMVLAKDDRDRYVYPTKASEMESFVKKLKVHESAKEFFAASVNGTMEVFGLGEIRDIYFAFEPGPDVYAEGELWMPLEMKAMISKKTDAFKKVASTQIRYRHSDKYFSFSLTLERIDVAIAAVSGSLGFEYSPSLFGIYLGYPETLVGDISIFHLGMGVAFRVENAEDFLIKFKLELGLRKELDIAIVYIKGFLNVGVEGTYIILADGDDFIALELWLTGGLEGGIRALGKRYNIISFYLDARGKLSSYQPYKSWYLEASCSVTYSLNVWIHTFEGSVTAKFDTTIGW